MGAEKGNQMNRQDRTGNNTRVRTWLRGVAMLCTAVMLACGGAAERAEQAGVDSRGLQFDSVSVRTAGGADVLAQVSLSPSNVQFGRGTGQQFAVRALDPDGKPSDLTAQARFAVLDAHGHDTGVRPDAEGIVQIEEPGRYVLVAEVAGRRLSTPVTVTAATVKSISVSPTSPSVGKGATLQFAAIATMTDATTQDVTKLATWAVKDLVGSGVATIDTTGLLSANAVGRATISARYKTRSASTQVEVTPATLSSMLISPADPTIAKGTSIRFAAMGVYSDGTSADVTRQVTWEVTDLMGTRVASIDGTGLANGVSEGAATISADFMGLTAATTLTVSAARAVSLSVTPANTLIPKGTTQAFTALATLTDGSTQNVTAMAAWTSTDRSGTGVATIGAGGVAKGNAVGSATITAVYMGNSATAVLGVTAAVQTGVVISPASGSVGKGGTLAMVATGQFSDGSTQDVTATAVWTVADVMGTDVASISSPGRLLGKNLGKAKVTVTSAGASASAIVEVVAPKYKAVSVSCPPLAASGTKVRCTATATLTDGATSDVSTMATWAIVDPTGSGAATVDSTGLVTCKSSSIVSVTATFAGFTGSAVVFIL